MPSRTGTTIVYDKVGNVVSTTTVTWTVTAAQDNEDTIDAQAVAALTTNRAFLALASPTNAQIVAQVQALTRQNVKLIWLMLDQLDGTD